MTSPLDVGRLRLLREVGLRGSIAGCGPRGGPHPVGGVAAARRARARDRRRAAGPLAARGRADRGRRRRWRRGPSRCSTCSPPPGPTSTGWPGSLGRPRRASRRWPAPRRPSCPRPSGRCARPPPGIEVTVVAAEPERGIGLLLTGDVDLAVVDEYDYVPLALPEAAVVRELGVEPLVVVRPAGPARRRGRRSPSWPTPTGSCRPRTPPAAGPSGRPAGPPASSRGCGGRPTTCCCSSGPSPHGHGVAVLPRRSVPADAAGVDVRPPAASRRSPAGWSRWPGPARPPGRSCARCSTRCPSSAAKASGR